MRLRLFNVRAPLTPVVWRVVETAQHQNLTEGFKSNKSSLGM